MEITSGGPQPQIVPPSTSQGRCITVKIKQLIAGATVAGAVGFSAFGLDAGVANAAPPAALAIPALHAGPTPQQGPAPHGAPAPQQGRGPAQPPPPQVPRGGPGPVQPPSPQTRPDDHGNPPQGPPGGDWRGRFHNAPWGDGAPPWGWGAPPPPAWDGPLPPPDGPPPPPINYWGYWCQPVWDPGFYQWGFWFFGVWIAL